MAIKVRLSTCTQPDSCSCTRRLQHHCLCCWVTNAGGGQVPVRCWRQQLGKRDPSAVQGESGQQPACSTPLAQTVQAQHAAALANTCTWCDAVSRCRWTTQTASSCMLCTSRGARCTSSLNLSLGESCSTGAHTCTQGCDVTPTCTSACCASVSGSVYMCGACQHMIASSATCTVVTFFPAHVCAGVVVAQGD